MNAASLSDICWVRPHSFNPYRCRFRIFELFSFLFIIFGLADGRYHGVVEASVKVRNCFHGDLCWWVSEN